MGGEREGEREGEWWNLLQGVRGIDTPASNGRSAVESQTNRSRDRRLSLPVSTYPVYLSVPT